MKNIFPDFVPSSKVWIYLFDKKLNAAELSLANAKLSAYMNEWHAHHQKVKGTFTIIDNCILILAADETNTMISGCSIDSTMRVIKEISSELNIDLFNRMQIAALLNNEFEIIKTNEIAQKITDSSTVIFNTTATTLQQLNDKPTIAIGDSWAKNFM